MRRIAVFGFFGGDQCVPSCGDARTAVRFSFTYRRTGGQWLILDHHSSLMPAAPS